MDYGFEKMQNEGKIEEKMEESLNSLIQICRELDIKENEEDINELEASTSIGSDEEVAPVPEENKLELTEHEDPLKSSVSPEYVQQVMRELDYMTSLQLKVALKELSASTVGSKKELRKRVANLYRKEQLMMSRRGDIPVPEKTFRYFDYLVCIDFECTCVEIIYDYPHEIIELPAVLINVKECKIVSSFRTYVRPARNPILSDFCVGFTNISQDTVDHAPYFREALEMLYAWMHRFGLDKQGVRFAFVTDGPHDLWKFMQFQCLLSGMRMPHMFRSFINIKKIFKDRFHGIPKGNGKSGIENMLAKFGLEFEGTRHSGLDDATNIAKICLELMRRKVELRINQKCVYKTRSKREVDSEDDEDGDESHRVDLSHRDFRMWMRKLPLKLQTVTRRDFLTEEYLDCESCDENDNDQKENLVVEKEMEMRKHTQQLIAKEFEEEKLKYSIRKAKGSENLETGVLEGEFSGEIIDTEQEFSEISEGINEKISEYEMSTDEEIDLESVWDSEIVESTESVALEEELEVEDIDFDMDFITESASTVSENASVENYAPRNSLASTNRSLMFPR